MLEKFDAAFKAASTHPDMVKITDKILMPINYMPGPDAIEALEASQQTIANMIKITGFQPK